MMKPFEHTGYWWDPREPETKWPGTLRFDPVAGATLTRTLSVDVRAFLMAEGREFPTIFGETTGGANVTLVDCFERNHSEIFANAVLTGFHADDADPEVLVAAAAIERLADWYGRSSIELDPSLSLPSIGLRYLQPEALEVHADETTMTWIRSSGLPSLERGRVSVEEEIRVETKAHTSLPLSAFRKHFHAIQDLLSVASLGLCDINDFRFIPASNPKLIAHYYAVAVFKNPAERWDDFLFRYVDVSANVRDVFTSWLKHAERLSAVRSLYLSAAYGKAFLEIKLLALTQAAEAFHRRMNEETDLYMDPAEYAQNVLPQLVAGIPAGLEPSHRQALRNRMKYGNEFSFRKRLTALFVEHRAALGAAIPQSDAWIGRIVDHRNYLTHHPVVDHRMPGGRLELLKCNLVLRCWNCAS